MLIKFGVAVKEQPCNSKLYATNTSILPETDVCLFVSLFLFFFNVQKNVQNASTPKILQNGDFIQYEVTVWFASCVVNI